jgi:hypothetical protein
MYLKKMEQFIKEKTKLPLRDRYDLPSSELTFKGGAHYRIEISGIETVSNMENMIKEAEKRNVTIHRVISVVKGSALMDNAELKEFARIAADHKFEVVINPAATRGWDNGRQYITKEGYVSGMRMRGSDMAYLWLKEFDRCLEAGIRGFLIPDEGLLNLLNKMRADNVIPKDTKFKVSVFAGHGSALGGTLLESMGADSFNPLGDCTLPMLASIRSALNIPMDVYVSLVESMGGFQRCLECDEMARIAAPVYFKIEPGSSEGALYNTWVDPNYLDHLARERVKIAQICIEWVERCGKNIVFNDYKEDLSIPQP